MDPLHGLSPLQNSCNDKITHYCSNGRFSGKGRGGTQVITYLRVIHVVEK